MSNIQGLLDALRDRPQDFRCSKYTLIDTKTQAEYWTSNGLFFYAMYSPDHYEFSLCDKIRFHFALKRWRAGYLNLLNILATAADAGRKKARKSDRKRNR